MKHRAQQGIGAIVNRHQGQLVVRFFLWLAPDDIGALKNPVAEGHDDIVVLKSLALVDRQYAHTVDLVASYVFVAKGSVPFVYEGVDVGSGVCGKPV